MEPKNIEPKNDNPAQRNPKPASAVEHVAGAHRLMQDLQKRIGQHPELEEAVHNLEMALSVLTVKTGGLL